MLSKHISGISYVYKPKKQTTNEGIVRFFSKPATKIPPDSVPHLKYGAMAIAF